MDNYWPDPIEKIELHEAVTKRQTTATIGGRRFKIRYEENEFIVSPVEGFVPSGHFDYKHTFDEILGKD